MKITPQKMQDLDMTFGPRNVYDLMPEYKDIPEDFKNHYNKWAKVISTWFFEGLPEGIEFNAKPGIPAETAFRHVTAVLRSWTPKHEHKEAACAYMLSEWFDDIVDKDGKSILGE